MSLVELQEELKEQIKEAEKAETEEVNAEEAPVEEEEKKDEPEAEEEKKEEVKEESKEEAPDKAAFARMRRDKAAAEKRADEAEARAARKEEVIAEEAPSYIAEDPELKEIKREHVYAKAEREFTSMENEFKRDNPEYGAVATEYGMALAQSIRIQNPRLSEIEITERTKKTILEKAGSLMAQGYNPIEEMYHQAKDLGFTGKSLQKKEEEAKEEPRPDMKKVAENRKKSAGMAAASGESKGQVTKQYAAQDMTNEEWRKLPQAEKQRLLYG